MFVPRLAAMTIRVVVGTPGTIYAPDVKPGEKVVKQVTHFLLPF